ncbi:MAG: hypothetical protein ABW202_03970 [Duganella sp.]
MHIGLACILAGVLNGAAAERLVDAALPVYQPQPVSVPSDAAYVTPDGAVRLAGAEHVQ